MNVLANSPCCVYLSLTRGLTGVVFLIEERARLAEIYARLTACVLLASVKALSVLFFLSVDHKSRCRSVLTERQVWQASVVGISFIWLNAFEYLAIAFVAVRSVFLKEGARLVGVNAF